ncbi:MAG: ATP-dependent DNA helicase RecG [Firmicutes bacterium]|nr:ATP-dependent DNA helicase RecG [Bacillota bacterium]
MEIKLQEIKGVGPSILNILRNNHIWSTYDLILKYPKAYEDFTIISLNQANHKDTITVQATITSELQMQRYSKRERVSFHVKVFDQIIEVIVFGRGYLMKQLKVDDQIVIKGVYHLYRKQIVAASVMMLDKNVPIKPIYGIEGVYDRILSSIVQTIFNEDKVSIFETIPKQFLDMYHLLPRVEAYKKLHLPKTVDDIHQAERRFKYEEAFYLQLKLMTDQSAYQKRAPKPYDLNKVKAVISELPYTLTQDQKDAVNDIFRDFKKPYASYRLIQGDVGSGKTLVTLIAIYATITAGEQVSFMAPTELLANQHYQYFQTHLKSCRIALLSGKTKRKDLLKAAIKNHEYDLIIGTHALIEDDVEFNNLGLVIIDEQHKFGVNTRDELIAKAHAKDVIYLTATPIPRTLAMIAFGESHVSIIKEKPKDRISIETFYIQKDQIEDLYTSIDSAIERNEHVFLVVPAIDSTKVADNIDSVYEEIYARFSCPIFVLHGKLPNEEKERIMENFIYSPGSIMLATTMIEVGIDIPTATLIGIYSAEHFGLSQLHQLRGRVGRSTLKSACYLISEKEDVERLELLSKINDGFKLSEYDLIARGPGDFLGVEQSGYVKFNFLDLISDYPILIEAQKNVSSLISKPDFKTNPIYKYLNKYITESLKI